MAEVSYHNNHPIEAHNAEFKRINERLKGIDERLENGSKTLYELSSNQKLLEKDVKEFDRRMEKEEKQTEAMLDIAHSVKDMTKTLESVVAKQGDHEKILNGVLNNPGQIAIKSWVFVGSILGSSIVMGIIGLVIGAIK